MANITRFNSDILHDFNNLQFMHIDDDSMGLVDTDNELILRQFADAVYFDVLGVESCPDGDLAEASVQLHLASAEAVLVEHVVGRVEEMVIEEEQTLGFVPAGRKRVYHPIFPMYIVYLYIIEWIFHTLLLMPIPILTPTMTIIITMDK